ncbi:MAG: RNA polymerase-binding protein DksA [Salinisphaeraceae bacterium]|nr:RNA polymerase-binding protein DksA [Salinisphaeraceae bacterium]
MTSMRKTATTPPRGPYLNVAQREYFRRRLLDWRQDILQATQTTIEGLRHGSHFQGGDEGDRALRESAQTLELRARDRQRKLLRKIDQALERIRTGQYGYCEETGEPIGLDRLDIRPVATLCIAAQEAHERREKHIRG